MARTLTSIMDEVVSYKGRVVRCRTSKGRNKVEETEGIVMDTYPKFFTLYVKSRPGTVSFSYAELLTKEVELEIVPST
ncbi:MAG: Veg family protein [Synergistaceae bacterium]|jgi:uncharacterized protein Veg|nr:Veg family protein [Synergistaceae bacterium]